MQLFFNRKLADRYVSYSQKIRVLSEDWVESQIYCPNCGAERINSYPNNRPVADMFCSICKEDFELKGKKKVIGNKIVDGAYSTMVQRLSGLDNPNFFLMTYEPVRLEVTNFIVIPKHFFTPEIIEKRKPLASTAKRAGWIGCNILLKSIPQAGRVFFVRDRQPIPKEKVLAEWKKTLFLRDEGEISKKGWIIDIMRCIDKLGLKKFTLADIYSFERELSTLHPNNKHIKDKIRQLLQMLRDKGYLKFTGRGHYVPL